MKNTFKALIVSVIFFGIGSIANASSITFDLEDEFSGGYSPVSTTKPWLTATFDDGGGTGEVILTMNAVNLTAAEFISEWSFNLADSFGGNLATLGFTSLSGDAATSIVQGANSTVNVNTLKADGDGYFDFMFVWGNGVFIDGETVVYKLTLDGITASSFDVQSAPGGGNGSWATAAHIQGIDEYDTPGVDTEGSGWIGGSKSVPEPAMMLLFGTGLVGLVGVARRRNKK